MNYVGKIEISNIKRKVPETRSGEFQTRKLIKNMLY
jgi:hypothetical protein